METPQLHIGSLETRLKQWGAKLDDLAAKIEQTGAQTRKDYRQGIKDLQAKYKVTQVKLEEARAAGAEKWDIVKSGFDAAWDDFEDTFKKLNA